jgi:hypothetical protein
MDVLIPLLEDRQLISLEIVCDHLPRWFTGRISALNLKADVKKSAQGITAVVSTNS